MTEHESEVEAAAREWYYSQLPSLEECRHGMDLVSRIVDMWDQHWTVPAWTLERHSPESWGTWHRECWPQVPPPEPIRIANEKARALAAELEEHDPAWRPHCRVCRGLLSKPPRRPGEPTEHPDSDGSFP